MNIRTNSKSNLSMRDHVINSAHAIPRAYFKPCPPPRVRPYERHLHAQCLTEKHILPSDLIGEATVPFFTNLQTNLKNIHFRQSQMKKDPKSKKKNISMFLRV